jgi:hypothetical protein
MFVIIYFQTVFQTQFLGVLSPPYQTLHACCQWSITSGDMKDNFLRSSYRYFTFNKTITLKIPNFSMIYCHTSLQVEERCGASVTDRPIRKTDRLPVIWHFYFLRENNARKLYKVRNLYSEIITR